MPITSGAAQFSALVSATKVGRETNVRLLVEGKKMGPKEIGKLIKLLEAQKEVPEDDDEAN